MSVGADMARRFLVSGDSSFTARNGLVVRRRRAIPQIPAMIAG